MSLLIPQPFCAQCFLSRILMTWHKWGEKICEACWCSWKAELCPLCIQRSWWRYEWEIYLFLECKGFSELWELSQFFLFLNTHNAALNIEVQTICISCWWWVLCLQNILNFIELLFVWARTICYFTFPDVQCLSMDRKCFIAAKRYQWNFDLRSLSDGGRLGREQSQGCFGETFCLQMSRNTCKEAKKEQSCPMNGITLTFPEELQDSVPWEGLLLSPFLPSTSAAIPKFSRLLRQVPV